MQNNEIASHYVQTISSINTIGIVIMSFPMKYDF